MKRVLSVVLFLVAIISFSAVKEVKGVFKGENLVLRSSLDAESNSYCVTDIYLNGEQL